jgi:hypothetical protein
MRNLLIIPVVTLPIVVVIVSSPMWVYIVIKTWNPIVITPTMIMIM